MLIVSYKSFPLNKLLHLFPCTLFIWFIQNFLNRNLAYKFMLKY